MRRFATGFFAAIALASTAQPQAARAAEKVAMGIYSGTDYLIAFIAKDHGFFDRHGLDVSFQFLTANMALMTSALVGNSLQIGATTVPVVLQADDNGLDIEIIGGATATGPGFHLAAVLVRPDLDITDAKGLEGRTVAVGALNSFSHILLKKWLAEHGADPAKVHFVETPLAQFGDALTSRKLDAVVPVEPYLTRLQATGQAKLLADFVDDLPAGIRPIIWAATGAYVRAHREAIAGFRAGLADALAYYRTHPESGDEALAHYIKMPPDILKAIPKPPLVIDVRPEHVKFWSDMMFEQHLLSRRIDPASVLAP